jgi:hypothetical protein
MGRLGIKIDIRGRGHAIDVEALEEALREVD